MYRIDPALVRDLEVGFVFVADGNPTGATARNVVKARIEGAADERR